MDQLEPPRSLGAVGEAFEVLLVVAVVNDHDFVGPYLGVTLQKLLPQLWGRDGGAVRTSNHGSFQSRLDAPARRSWSWIHTRLDPWVPEVGDPGYPRPSLQDGRDQVSRRLGARREERVDGGSTNDLQPAPHRERQPADVAVGDRHPLEVPAADREVARRVPAGRSVQRHLGGDLRLQALVTHGV